MSIKIAKALPGLVLGWTLMGCAAHVEESQQPYDPEETEIGSVEQGLVPPPATGTAYSCASTSECNNLGVSARPQCSSPKWNVCRDAYCVWQIDSSQSQCKCVPGTLRRCTAGGISTCNAQGTGWGACQ